MRNYLTKPLAELVGRTSSQGIAQPDVILRTAIIAGIQDLRDNPGLLDYVFSSLPKDPLTYNIYGENQVNQAKDWFLKTDIPVVMNTRLDETKVPCVSIGIESSNEAEATLGDVHYETSEEVVSSEEEIYGGPFTPIRYVPSTATLVFNSDFPLDLFPGMWIKTVRGTSYKIQDVIDKYTVVLPEGTNDTFAGCYITSGKNNKQHVSLEAIEFREQYSIGCHVLGEPIYLTYLHSIILFVLLRYKEQLIEARGITRSTLSSAAAVINSSFDLSQPVFTRMITMTGYVRQYWPKFMYGPIIGLTVDMDVLNEIGTVVVTLEEMQVSVQEAYDLLVANKPEEAKVLLGNVININPIGDEITNPYIDVVQEAYDLLVLGDIQNAKILLGRVANVN